MTGVTVKIKDIVYNPGLTQYTVMVEVPRQAAIVGLVVKTYDGKIAMHPDSKVNPAAARYMIAEVREHIAQVNLD